MSGKLDSNGNEMKSPAKNRKGERPGFDKDVSIHLYPSADESPTKLDKAEEANFNVANDYRLSKKDKSNMRDLKIVKLESLHNNAEAYCQLIRRLTLEKWNKEDPAVLDNFMKAKDFSYCLHTQCAYTYNAAIEQMLKQIESYVTELIEYQKYETTFSPTEISGQGMEGFKKVFKENFQEFHEILSHQTEKLTWTFVECKYWEAVARIVFLEPYKAYKTQLSYLKYDIRKPYNESFASFKARVEEVFDYLDKFPVPGYKNSVPSASQFQNKHKWTNKEEVREAIFDALPKTWRDEFEKREPKDMRKVEEIQQFIFAMHKIEEEDKAHRQLMANTPTERTATQKRARNPNSNNNNNRSEMKAKKHQNNKMCNKCKRAGRSQFAYMSHSDAECKGTDHQTTKPKTQESSFQKDMRKQMLTLTKHQMTKLKRKKDDSDESESE